MMSTTTAAMTTTMESDERIMLITTATMTMVMTKIDDRMMTTATTMVIMTTMTMMNDTACWRCTKGEKGTTPTRLVTSTSYSRRKYSVHGADGVAFVI